EVPNTNCFPGNAAAECRTLTTVIAMPRIEVRKTVDLATANPGDVLHYTIAVANTGSADAVNVDVSDDISRLLDHGSLTAASAGGTLSGGILRWNNLSIDADTATALTFAVRLDVAGWA